MKYYFHINNIETNYTNFKEVIYNQSVGDFIPDLNIIDYIFNQ